MKNYRIRFQNFWKSFSQTDNIFVDLIENLGFAVDVVRNLDSKVDLEIVSVFPSRIEISGSKLKSVVRGEYFPGSLTAIERSFTPRFKGRAARRIWYTGENVRPPLDHEFDAYLSFDQKFMGENNFYFPLWMHDIGWFSSPRFNKRLGRWCHISDLTSGREQSKIDQNGFCAFVGNPDPLRLHLINELSRVMDNGLYGSYFGKTVSDKLKEASRFRFMVCFENDLYPGYVTEKIVEAYLSGTIPIYWGDFGFASGFNFNSKSFLNLHDFNSTDAFVMKVLEVNNDWQNIFTEPLLLERPSIERIQHALTGF